MNDLLQSLRDNPTWHTARQLKKVAPNYDPDALAELVKAGLVVRIENHILGEVWKAAVNVPKLEDSADDAPA